MRSLLSGILIGAELGAARLDAGRRVFVVGGGGLSSAYCVCMLRSSPGCRRSPPPTTQAALSAVGCETQAVAAEAATVAGARAVAAARR